MPRFLMRLARPARFRYLDTPHAALVTALCAAGATQDQVVGERAVPWTFATSGRASPGGSIRIDAVTLSTPDPALGIVMTRLDGHHTPFRSNNGDDLDFSGAVTAPDPLPLHPDQDSLTITFASPFLVSKPGSSAKSYVRNLADIDLSAAFSAGLSRRLQRDIRMKVEEDRLAAATEGAAPRLVRVRKSGRRDLILPAISTVLTLKGRPADLRDAYLAGLGEKTRYGFGCPVALA